MILTPTDFLNNDSNTKLLSIYTESTLDNTFYKSFYIPNSNYLI